MPLVDLPIEQLTNYQGRNPRPEDFDTYWDESLLEMQAVDASPTRTPVESPCNFADLYGFTFTGVGGARVYAKLVVPKKPNGAGLVEFHGYSWHSGDWLSKLAWAAQGFVIASLDCRGQGGLSEDVGGVRGTTHNGHIIRGLNDPDPKKLLFRNIYLDCAQLAGLVMAMPEVDANRVGAFGGSQGGGLTLACAALEPRIKRAAPTFPFLCDFKRVWEMDLAKDAYGELRTFFKHFDPRHHREDEIFNRLGYIDVQHLAPRIDAKVLMAVGLMDTICPPSSQFAAYNKIRSPKEVVLYPDFGHEGLTDWNDLTFEFLCGL
jgi:cephalosporin-C deacetylase